MKITENMWLKIINYTTVVVMAVFVFVGVIFIYNYTQKTNQEIEAFRVQGEKSSVHRFVVDKYLVCNEEFNSSRDMCVARVMVLARVQGAGFETQVATAIRDLKLDRPKQ